MKRLIVILLVVAAVLSLTACGGEKEKPFEPDLDALYEKILAETGTQDMDIQSEKHISKVIGVDSADYTKAVIALCGDSVLADEIWLVQAVDAAAAERVLAVAKDRLEYRAGDFENYLPDQYEIVKQAKVLQRGNVIAVFVSPEAEQMKSIFEAA